MKHLNMIKTAAEIKRLRELNDTQKDTILKAMKCIETLADDCCKLQDENKKLKSEVRRLKDLVTFHQYMRSSPDDVIFPNTDERGLGEGDTPSDLSPLDL